MKSRRMKWLGHVTCLGGKEKCAYVVILGKRERTKSFGRSRRKWICHIKKVLEYDGKVWTG